MKPSDAVLWSAAFVLIVFGVGMAVGVVFLVLDAVDERKGFIE